MIFRVEPVWRRVTPALAAELARFWLDNGAIADPHVAQARALDAVCVARNESGAILAVGTATLEVLPRLRQPMYYYRQYFAASFRGRRQALPFYRRCRAELEAHNAALARAESLGLVLELGSPAVDAAFRRVHEPGYDAVFIGYSPLGTQLRASYFDGAVLLPITDAPVAGAPDPGG